MKSPCSSYGPRVSSRFKTHRKQNVSSTMAWTVSFRQSYRSGGHVSFYNKSVCVRRWDQEMNTLVGSSLALFFFSVESDGNQTTSAYRTCVDYFSINLPEKKWTNLIVALSVSTTKRVVYVKKWVFFPTKTIYIWLFPNWLGIHKNHCVFKWYYFF